MTGASAQTGGKGSVRRKKKGASRNSSAPGDAKLNSALKKLNITQIPGIEQVNLFRDDGQVVHFSNPKVQASIQANTYIVSGSSAVKSIQELFPDIIQQLGQENVEQMRQAMAQMAPGMGGMPAEKADEDDEEDEIPELVDNFEEESNKA